MEEELLKNDFRTRFRLNDKVMMILKVIATVLFFSFILFKVGTQRIIQSWHHVKHFEVVLAFVIAPFVVFLGTYKWKLIIQASGLAVNWRRATVSFLGGMAVGLVTPIRAGELSRIFFLPGRREALLGIAMVDKAIDLESLLLLATLGCVVVSWKVLAIIFALGSTVLFFLIALPQTYTFFLRRYVTNEFLKRKSLLMIAAIEGLSLKSIMYCLLIRFVLCAFDIIQFALLIHAMSSPPLKAVFATYPLMVLVNTFPITIGGVGVREATAAIVLNRFGIPAYAAVTAAFLLFCINTLLPGLIGACFLGQASRYRQLRA